MIRINSTYSDYYDNSDPGYPGGKAINTSTDDSEDGTPYKAEWMNDVLGFFQAAIVAAHGEFRVSGKPDKVGESDILDALVKIIIKKILQIFTPENILSALLEVDGIDSGLDADLFGGQPPEYYLSSAFLGCHIKEISGVKTIISWEALKINYDAEKEYMIFISAHGLYKDFVSFPCEAKTDGLHIYPQKFENGKLIGGTNMRKWGAFKWGEGVWGKSDSMKINIQIKEA
jgi:hypothetical protein